LPPLIFVVDALDECDSDDDVKVIVQLFAEARWFKTARLRIFITSRPEVPIRQGFYGVPDAEHEGLCLHHIPRSIVDRDISAFLEYNFKLIRLERALPADWPGEEALQILVWKSNGLFIWAASACRFIRDGRPFARKRLSMILQDSPPFSAPDKRLNELYLTILENSVSSEYDDQEKVEIYRILREVLGSIVILHSPLSSASLAKLLHIHKGELEEALEDLHAILDIPKIESNPIRLHHPSFRDFLLWCEDPRFWVDEKQAHGALAENCIQLISSTLKRDICHVQAPGTLVGDIRSSWVEVCIPLEVQYACLYWVNHLQRSGAQLYDNDKIHQFLQEHLLHWLEGLSLIGRTSEGVLAVSALASHISVSQMNTRMVNRH
jgi:hypothetical protein